MIGLVAAVYLAFSVPTATAAQGWALFVQWVASGFAMDLPPKADLIVPFFKTSPIRSASSASSRSRTS